MRKIVVFDLDGTLLDTTLHIETALISSFEAHGLGRPNSTVIRGSIGLPLDKILLKLSVPNSLVEVIISDFRKTLDENLEMGTPFFDFVPDVLTDFTSHGYLIGVATSKPTYLAIKTLAHSGLRHFPLYIQGTDNFAPKPSPVIFEKLNQKVANARIVMMVGDRCEDIKAGVTFKIPTIGVAQTSHSLDMLREAGASLVFSNFQTLMQSLEDIKKIIDRVHL